MGHASHERCRGAALLGTRLERVELKLEGGVALGGHAHGAGAVGAREAVHGDVERRRDDVAALVVRVVAGDLGASRGVNVEGLAAQRAKGVLEELRDVLE